MTLNATTAGHKLTTIFGTEEQSRCQVVGEDGLLWPSVFCETYFLAHGYIALSLCAYGLLSNIFTVIIFSRTSMRTPVNLLLAAIALAGTLTMLPYIPYAIYFNIIIKCVKFECASQYSQFWVTYMLVSNRLFLTFHNVAIWLTVALSIIRWISVCHHVQAKTLCSLARVKLTIVIVYFVGIVSCIPTYLEFKVENYGNNEYWLAYSFDMSENLKDINFILYAAVLRLVPCAVMIGFSVPIIVKVQEANKTRKKMFSNEESIRQTASAKTEMLTEKESQSAKHSTKSFANSPSKRNKGSRQSTTIMLVTIVLFFVSVEMPIGLVCLISGFSTYFSTNVYVYLGDLQDDLVLLNSAVNFTLFCVMSAQFRSTCVCAFGEWQSYITSIFSKQKDTPTRPKSTSQRKIEVQAEIEEEEEEALELSNTVTRRI